MANISLNGNIFRFYCFDGLSYVFRGPPTHPQPLGQGGPQGSLAACGGLAGARQGGQIIEGPGAEIGDGIVQVPVQRRGQRTGELPQIQKMKVLLSMNMIL